jgi:hypothetical protein
MGGWGKSRDFGTEGLGTEGIEKRERASKGTRERERQATREQGIEKQRSG